MKEETKIKIELESTATAADIDFVPEEIQKPDELNTLNEIRKNITACLGTSPIKFEGVTGGNEYSDKKMKLMSLFQANK